MPGTRHPILYERHGCFGTSGGRWDLEGGQGKVQDYEGSEGAVGQGIGINAESSCMQGPTYSMQPAAHGSTQHLTSQLLLLFSVVHILHLVRVRVGKIHVLRAESVRVGVRFTLLHSVKSESVHAPPSACQSRVFLLLLPYWMFAVVAALTGSLLLVHSYLML